MSETVSSSRFSPRVWPPARLSMLHNRVLWALAIGPSDWEEDVWVQAQEELRKGRECDQNGIAFIYQILKE